jgi:hypothetical protein
MRKKERTKILCTSVGWLADTADRSTCCIGAAARSIDQKILQFKKYWSTYVQAALLESCVGTRVRTRRHAPTRTPEPDADRSSTIQLALCTDCVCVRIIDSMSSGMLDRKEPAAQTGLSLVCAQSATVVHNGPVHLAYNSSYSACFFSRNSIFLSRKISQRYFSAGL